MADNVVRFRKIEKKPDPTPGGGGGPRKPRDWPAWLPWAVIIVVAIALTAVQQPRLFGL